MDVSCLIIVNFALFCEGFYLIEFAVDRFKCGFTAEDGGENYILPCC